MRPEAAPAQSEVAGAEVLDSLFDEGNDELPTSPAAVPPVAVVQPRASAAPSAAPVAGVPPARYTPDVAAQHSAAAKAAAQAPEPAAWPDGLPTREDSLAVLTAAVEPAPGQLAPTQAVLAALTDAEFSALNEPNPMPEVLVLREAVVTRWRLAVALATKPPQLKQINGPVLDALLNEADLSLGALKTVEGMDESLAQGYEAARGALARDAVTLSGAGQDLSQQSAAAAVESTQKKYKHVQARVTSIEAVDAKEAKKEAVRTRSLVVATVVVALAAFGFHGYRFVASSKPAGMGAPPGVPAGFVGVTNEATGVTMVRTPDGKPISDERKRELELQAESKGLGIVELAPGQVMMAPREIVDRAENLK